jgi:hypothetical protein
MCNILWTMIEVEQNMDRLPEMIAAYASMDPQAREMILTLALKYAKSWPEKLDRPAPIRLRLVRPVSR